MLWEVRGRLQCNSVEEILDSRELESRSEMQGSVPPDPHGAEPLVAHQSYGADNKLALTKRAAQMVN